MVDLSYLSRPQIDLTAGFNGLADALQRQQIIAAKTAEARREQQEEAAYQRDAAEVAANPTAEGYRQLMLRHPKEYQANKAGWDQYSEGEKKRNIDHSYRVYASIQNGRPDLALQILHQRRDALTRDGQDTTETDAIINDLESGDPQKVTRAQGLAGMAYAYAVGPDKVLDLQKEETTVVDGILINKRTGQPIAQSPLPRIIPGPDGAFYEQGLAPGIPVFGGGVSAPAPATTVPLPTPVGSNEGVPGSKPAAASIGPLDLNAASSLGSRYGKVTSTTRTPEHNKEVGGAPNSYHLSGHAIDIARNKGVSHGQIVAAYKKAGYQVIEAIDEGDHTHLALAGGSAAVQQTAKANGKTYYKIAGQWFDNPEGR